MSYISKTVSFLKRNGIVNTVYTVAERLSERKNAPYSFVPVSEDKLSAQKDLSTESPVKISIVIPLYETRKEYLKELIDCILNQSYGGFELILADASKSEGPHEVVSIYSDERIKYVKLDSNDGISENTNAAIKMASGDYVALCDHDDLLTPDALYEIVVAIIRFSATGRKPYLVYTDEDKCDKDATAFYEPNIKSDFNLDMLLSNNYICHITTVKREIINELLLRKEYDGAQDFDLALRVAGMLMDEGKQPEKYICHIPKVLYHWRCHELSTASNPESKNYAYEAGKRAIETFAHKHFGNANVTELMYKGFYRVNYGKNIFDLRKDLGAIGGYVTEGNKITGGAYNDKGESGCIITNRHFSGPCHTGALTRDVYALDLRALTPRPELKDLHANLLAEWTEEIQSLFDAPENKGKAVPYKVKEQLLMKYNLEFAGKAASKGYRLMLDPMYKASDYSIALDEEDSDGERLPVSVIIPNMNGKDYLKDCLDSIMASDDKPAEIIVVDNASADGSVSFVKENYPDVKVLSHKVNTGFTGAVNHGIYASTQPFVFLLNNDTKVEADCIKKLYDAIRSDETIFSCGALMLSMDDNLVVDNAGDSINILGYPRSFAGGKPAKNYMKDRVAAVFSCCAGASLYRKSILDEIGCFDDLHFAYFEDVDLGYRARVLGYKNVNVRNAVVYHKGSATTGSKHNKFKVSHSSKNSVILYTKNMPIIQYILNFPFLLAGYLIKFAFFTLKGLGGVYLKGLTEGFRLSVSKEGRLHHVKFKLKNFINYWIVELWMLNIY